MSIIEFKEQARHLSRYERKELALWLIETLVVDIDEASRATDEKLKTGPEIVALLEEIGPIETLYPEITDPVEWVEQIRRDQDRNFDWGDAS